MRDEVLTGRPARMATAGIRWQTALPVACLAAFSMIALYLIATLPYPEKYDELEHVSYAAFLQESGRLLPRFEAQRILAIDSLTRWTDLANYLGHPSPFYLYISLFLDRTLAFGRAILQVRLASAGLILAGVALALLAGRRHFRGDPLACAVFCLALALCPKLLAVSGQVTNDALAVLGGALAYWGAGTEGRRRRQGLAGVALGVVLACWAKPNAGLLVAVLVGGVALLRAGRRAELLGALAAGLAAGSIPYWFIMARYGALVPVSAEQFGHVRQLGGLAAYLPAFVATLGYTWSFLHTGAWPLTSLGGWATVALFWAVVFCTAAAWVPAAGVATTWRPASWLPAAAGPAGRRGLGARDAIAVAAPLAFFVVLPIHFWFCATRLGFSLPAASVRYYLPLWPAMAHALAYAAEHARLRATVAGVVAVALVVGWWSP